MSVKCLNCKANTFCGPLSIKTVQKDGIECLVSFFFTYSLIIYFYINHHFVIVVVLFQLFYFKTQLKELLL